MKKIIGAIFVSGFLLVSTAYADTSTMGNMMNSTENTAVSTQQNQTPTIESVMQDIYKTQNISSQNQTNCSKVSDDQYEKLGDAIMGNGISEQQHTTMENMMGGEGSATVKQAHINMGRSYLGCWANYNATPSTMGMMGNASEQSNYTNSGSMQEGMLGNYSMMGGLHRGFAWFCAITMLLVWGFLILAIIALLKWLRKNRNS